MKKCSILILIALMTNIAGWANWRVFVPESGEFNNISIPDSVNTINKIGEFLGYGPGKFYTYHNFDDESIDLIMFKVFSEDIIAVVSDYPESILPKKIVNRFLIGYNYYKDYSPYNWESDLDEAINKGLYSKEFMCEVLHLPYSQYENKRSFIDKKHGYRYEFDNDILVSYSTSNGLNRYVKEYKEINPKFYNEMSSYIRGYWGQNEDEYLKEINAQFKAFCNIPQGWQNPLIDVFYIQGDYVHNFVILDMIVNHKELSFQDFKDFTHNTAKLISNKQSPLGKILTYRYKMLDFYFDQDGNFLKWEIAE